MSNKELQEKSQSEVQRRLQSKPQRRSGWRLSFLLLLLGGVIIVGGAGILAWQALSHQAPPVSTTGPSANKQDKGQQNQQLPPGPQGDRPVYWQTIKDQVAQGLHLSVAQIQAELIPSNPASKSNPKQIGDVAMEHGVLPDQLHTIEVNAIQKGFDKLVSQGIETQQQADQWMQVIRNWALSDLNGYVTDVFVNH